MRKKEKNKTPQLVLEALFLLLRSKVKDLMLLCTNDCKILFSDDKIIRNVMRMFFAFEYMWKVGQVGRRGWMRRKGC